MTLANKITIIRIALTPFFLIFLIYSHYVPALIFFLASAITDGLDGFFARKRRQITKIGSFLDPLADKAFLIPTYVSFVLVGAIPKWLFVLLICRDFAILLGWLLWLIKEQELKANPRLSGKMTIATQMIFFVLVMSKLAFPNLETPMFNMILEFLMYIIASITFVSFADYLALGTKTLAAKTQ
ncbi:MAG: CDP-alcohol phosphatidyltransferase family protein [Elusimicrobia bacterium]|nr:CDP-alcohol phosphatidyltransferase family protein [Elusimicrobiota bacterium]